MTYIAISFWGYTLIVFLIGVASAWFSKNTKQDFFLADRGLGAWVAGLSGAASVESGWVTLGLVGAGYKSGLGVYWVVPATAVSFAVIWFVLAPRISRLATKQGALTLTDILSGDSGTAASRWIRLLAVMISVGMLTLYVASQLSAAGKMFNGAFGWTPSVGLLVGLFITLTYTVTGGFRAVAWTDVIQAVLMFVAMVIVPLVLVSHLGGWDGYLGGVQAIDETQAGFAQWDGGQQGWALLAFFSLWLGIPLGNAGQPHLAVRLLAAKDERAIFRGGIISVIWVTVLFTGAVTLGIATRCHFGVIADPENSLLFVAKDPNLLHGLIGGLVVAAVLAAICSTVDSQLLVAASNVSSDLLGTGKKNLWQGNDTASHEGAVRDQKVEVPNASFLWWADRAAVLVVAGIAGAIGLMNNESVFDFVLKYGFAGLGAGFGPALALRLIWSDRSGDLPVLASMIAGIGTVIVWNLLDLGVYCYNMAPSVGASLMVGLLVRMAVGSKKVTATN